MSRAGTMAGALVMLAAYAGPSGAATAGLSSADALLAEINRARTDPSAYAERLGDYRALYRGRIVYEPGEPLGLETREGVAAVGEAIAALRHRQPLPPLAPDPVLAMVAADHLRDQGAAGLTGHQGRDGSNAAERLARRGLRPIAVGENIAYGPRSATAVVREFLIDDGVPDRGHRRNLLDPLFTRAGAACGPHKRYGVECVILFASATEVKR